MCPPSVGGFCLHTPEAPFCSRDEPPASVDYQKSIMIIMSEYHGILPACRIYHDILPESDRYHVGTMIFS